MIVEIQNTWRPNSRNNWSIFIDHSIEELVFVNLFVLLILFLFYKIFVLKLELLGIHTQDLVFYFFQAIYLLAFDIVRTAP